MKRDRINSLLVAVWLALFGIVNIYMSFTGISEIRGRALVVYIPIVFLMFSVLSREKINLNYKYFCAFFLYSISIVLSCLLNQVFDIRTILPIFIGLFLLLFVFLNLKLDLHRMLELFAVLVVVGIVLIITNVYINGIDFFSANYFLDTRINYYTDVNTSIFENKNTWGMVLTSCFIANRYCLIVCKDKFKRFLFITQQRYYFVHSYHAKCDYAENVLMTCDYGYEFTAAVVKENIYGVQFHPEKSHDFGLALLSNFAKRC